MKTLSGKIVSLKMTKTAIVEVTRYRRHPLYRKLLKSSKRYKADKGDLELEIGNNVKIVETKPLSKNKNFKVTEVIK
jgi:small subunit ribosomal protein S17